MQKEGWDWNHYQGTTSIKLLWNDLLAANSRQDERTDKQFAGALN